MNLRDIDPAAIEREEIRAIQGHYAKEHQALINMWKWLEDARGIYPPGVVSPVMWSDAPTSKWEHEDLGEYTPLIRMELGPAEKGDKPEPEPYLEGEAESLYDRIRGPGGLPAYLQSVIEVAYSRRYRNTQESQFHKLCDPSTTPHGFRERLEDCFIFVARFV